MCNYLNKRQDDNGSNSCTLVNYWLIVLLLLFTGDEYQCGTGRDHYHVGLQIRPNIGFVHIFRVV